MVLDTVLDTVLERLHEGGTLSSFRLPALGTLSMSRFVLA
jgi:hypothetical protein